MGELKLEIEIALSFIRAFLGNSTDDGFSDLCDDICDSYSVIVDAQIHQYILEKILNNIQRKEN